MRNFILTNRNGERWKYKGDSDFVRTKLLEKFSNENGNADLGFFPELEPNTIKQIVNSVINYASNNQELGFNYFLVNIRPIQPHQKRVYKIEFLEAQSPTKEIEKLPNDASAPAEFRKDPEEQNPTLPGQVKGKREGAMNPKKPVYTPPVPPLSVLRQRAQNIRQQDKPNEEFVESIDNPVLEEKDNPTLPGGKKKKSRKHTQRRKRNGPSKIRRHKTRRVF